MHHNDAQMTSPVQDGTASRLIAGRDGRCQRGLGPARAMAR